VQRSSISHILSGRNKPSLDFVLKVLASFPDVELYWLLNGKGQFPSEEKPSEIVTAPKTKNDAKHEVLEKTMPKVNATAQDKSIERIVIFYTDGSFKNFEDS
jgi:hypothetical protein